MLTNVSPRRRAALTIAVAATLTGACSSGPSNPPGTAAGRSTSSQPATGKVLLVRPGADGVGQVSAFLTGLRLPHDIVVASLGGQTWVYVAESNQVRRYPYQNGDATARTGQTLVANLPDASTPEL